LARGCPRQALRLYLDQRLARTNRLFGISHRPTRTLLIPPFAVGLGVLFLGEGMKLEASIGFTIIGLGFAVTDGRLFSFVFRKTST